MSLELWATYSVKDHLEPRALAADIMLFDRLVFPVPENGVFPENSGSPIALGPVEWQKNPTEWKRWKKNGWDPAAQKRLLSLLQPVIRKVSWGETDPKYSHYRSQTQKFAALGLPDHAFVATRTVLTRDLPAYVTGIAALGPAYRSIEEIESELGIGSAASMRVLPGGALPTVLAWEFLAPDPDDKRLSRKDLLRETVDFVTGDEAFRKRRTAFAEWQQKFLRDGATDRESIQRAVSEMRELLESVKSSTTKLTVRKIARYAFQIAPSALGLAAVFADIPNGLQMAEAGVFLSFGGIAGV
jgi:hypothetical protein